MSAAPPTAARDDAVTVVRHLRDSGHVAYLAGGCVRDLLLGRQPKDYDVATDAPPERVRKLFRNTQAVGAAFGVVLVRLGKTPVEVATFRTDGAYTDGRRPDSVRFATAEEDAKRRDFTINGLFMDPVTDEVIDHVGGRADLDAKLIRAIGNPDERFAEDHLRLLRAVRFAARLGFAIEPATADAIRRHAAELSRVAPERIGDELRRMFDGHSGQQVKADHELRALGLAAHAFRSLGVVGTLNHDELAVNWYALGHTTSFSSALAAIAFIWRWHRAGMTTDPASLFTKPEVAKIVQSFRRELKICNDEAAKVEGILLGVAWLMANPNATLAAKKRFAVLPTCDASLWLLATRVLSASVMRSGQDVARPLGDLQYAVRQLARTHVAPPPLLTGDDLTAAGATPGPAFKPALDAAYDAQLEGRATDRTTAMAIAMALL